MALPELYFINISGLKHYVIANSDKDACTILYQKLKSSSRALDIATINKKLDWVNTIKPNSEVWFTFIKFGVGYYDDKGLDGTFFPVSVRQYYIDLALEYIEHETSI